VAGVAAGLVGAGIATVAWPAGTEEEPVKRPQAAIDFEKTRPAAMDAEESREFLSSQHLQVKKSWENPGVYAWGSNSGRVAAPDSTDSIIKTPHRITYFDGQLLRDMKLDREFGAALTERGDLVQWGTGFSKDDPNPVVTLKGKDLVKLAISRDRILALSKSGTVYTLPVSNSDQSSGPKEQSSWLGMWSSPASVSYRKLGVPSLGWGERVSDICSGLDHALLLTNKGRIFSFASSNTEFPSKGQLGIPGLTWDRRPQGPYDQPHEVVGLKGFKITQVAAGDYHSLALDKNGKVFVFGDNTSGQLGFEAEPEIPYIDGPIPLPFNKLYRGSDRQPAVTSVAAGGANSFFTVDATRLSSQPGHEESAVVPAMKPSPVTADIWACGSGIFGSLGNGKWTHVSLGPSRIKALSGLSEWDDKTNSLVPIRVSGLSVGSNHSAAVLGNRTSVNTATSKAAETDTNFGADVVWWGGNEFFQVGTGKRSNVNAPTYIGPLDGGQGDAEKGRVGEKHRLQIAPRTTVNLGEGGKGRKVSVEQRVECGRFVTAVYSGV
jgi:alpha-tubulin suppressor-like RCC1 family protein